MRSGCATVGGMVRCDPESMRADAEAQLRAAGAIGRSDSLSQDAYSVARYIASEIGAGTTEELVAVAEAAVNQARKRGLASVTDLLLRLSSQRTAKIPSYGHYGPIHLDDVATCTRLFGPIPECTQSAKCARLGADRCCRPGCSPYGRWASTSKDPTVAHLLIARFVLAGGSTNFARGADDQYGPGASVSRGGSADWADRLTKSHLYWVGLLPGVDHWKTMLFRTMPSVDPSSVAGRAMVAMATAALSAGRPDWSRLQACSRVPGQLLVAAGAEPKVSAASLAGVAVALALAAGLGLGVASWSDRRY